MNHENIHEKCVRKNFFKKKTWNKSCKHPPENSDFSALLTLFGPFFATGLLAKSATDREPLSSKLSSISCASNCKYCWENLKNSSFFNWKKTCHWNVNYWREKGRRTFKKNINQLKKLTLHNIRCHVKVRLPWLHRSQGQDNTLQQPSARQQVIVQLVQGTITFSQGLGSFSSFLFCSTHKTPVIHGDPKNLISPNRTMNSIESPSKGWIPL